MTIPIIPGPFSFLQNFGRAASEAGQFKQKQQQIDYSQGAHTLQLLWQGIRDKTIKPEWAEPHLMQALQQMGAGGGGGAAGMIEPNPELTLSRERNRLLGDVIPSLGAGQREELISTGQIPTPSAVGAKQATEKATTAKAGLEETTATAATPLAPEVTTTQQGGAIKQVRDELAFELITQAAAQAGIQKANQMNYGLIQRAHTAGLQDPKYKGIDPGLLSAAYNRLRDQFRLREAQELGAAARYSSSDVGPRYLSIEQDQLDALNREYGIVVANPPDVNTSMMEAIATKQDPMTHHTAKVAEWQQRKAVLEERIRTANEALSGKIGLRTGAPTVLPAAPPPTGAPTPQQSSEPPRAQLQPSDVQRAKADPKFRAWLEKRGYKIP